MCFIRHKENSFSLLITYNRAIPNSFAKMKKLSWLLNAAVLLFYRSKPALCASIRYAVCEDNSTFQISLHGDDEEKKSCEWLQTQQAKIRDELCKDIEVRTHCSHSCGSCCWDDKAFRFKMESGRKSRSCYWLSKTSKRILKAALVTTMSLERRSLCFEIS